MSERDNPNEMISSRAMMIMANFTDAANSEECGEVWESWPLTQEEALREGTLVVFKVFPSVGNFFMVLNDLITVRHGYSIQTWG